VTQDKRLRVTMFCRPFRSSPDRGIHRRLHNRLPAVIKNENSYHVDPPRCALWCGELMLIYRRHQRSDLRP
jgi:hypothetical protein